MIESQIGSISEGGRVNNFQVLSDSDKFDLVLAMIRSGNITPFTALTEALLSNNALADALEGSGPQSNKEEDSLSFYHIKSIVIETLAPIIQDEIDEYNDAVDERNSEPERPNSDYL